MSQQQTPTIKAQQVARLSQQQYLALEARFPIQINKETTPEQIAAMLGEQRVLYALRKDIVVAI